MHLFPKEAINMSVEFTCTLTLPTNGPKTKEIPPFCKKRVILRVQDVKARVLEILQNCLGGVTM